MAVLVVDLALGGVRKDRIGLRRLFEFILGFLIAGVAVGMEFERALAVKLHSETIDRVKGEGVTVIPIDTKPLRVAVSPIYKEFSKKIGGMELIEKVINTP